MNTDTLILKNILANQRQQYIKRIKYHDQVQYNSRMQSWINIPKPKQFTT